MPKAKGFCEAKQIANACLFKKRGGGIKGIKKKKKK